VVRTSYIYDALFLKIEYMVRTQLRIIILYIVHTTTCFGIAYWPSSGCTTNLISGYTTMLGYSGGTRSRLTAVGGMFMS